MFFLVLRHPACASCVAWICCRMSNYIKHVWACPNLSSRRGHWFLIAIMLLLVIRHPTCVSCVAWMSCRMSNSIKHVRTCPDLSLDRLWLYTFLHCLRSNFSPSRPLQLWFEAARESSFARDIQHTPCKAPKKPDTTRFNCLFVCPVVVDDRRERQNIARANSEFFRYLLTLSLKKPSTHTHRLDTCLHSLRLNSSSLYPMLL
jgi:hypothetical protein